VVTDKLDGTSAEEEQRGGPKNMIAELDVSQLSMGSATTGQDEEDLMSLNIVYLNYCAAWFKHIRLRCIHGTERVERGNAEGKGEVRGVEGSEGKGTRRDPGIGDGCGDLKI